MSRYNIYSNQPDSGVFFTLDCNVIDKGSKIFVVTKYLNQAGKTIRLETETIKKEV